MATGDLFILHRSFVYYGSIGPLPTSRDAASTRVFGDGVTPGAGGSVHALTPEEIDAIFPRLRRWLRDHESPGLREWAKAGMIQQPAKTEILWFSHFLNGSIVVAPLMVVMTLAQPCVRVARRYASIRRGLCAHCAYDPRGTPGTLCPECGREVVASRSA